MERQAALEPVDPAESTNGQKAKEELHVGFSEAPPSVAVVDSTEVDAYEFSGIHMYTPGILSMLLTGDLCRVLGGIVVRPLEPLR